MKRRIGMVLIVALAAGGTAYAQLDPNDSANKPAEIEPLVDKWRAFGWWAEGVDGNDMERLLDVFEAARGVRDVPKAIVCRTTLGQGVPLIMERERNHFVRVGDDEWDAVVRQLEASA